MTPLWKFRGQYQGLREAARRNPDEFAYRQLAAELRALLLDAEPLGDAVKRVFRLTVFFPTLCGTAKSGFLTYPGGVALNELLLAGPPDTSKPAGSRIEHLSRDDFLALPAVRLPDGSTFKLRDAVVAGANLAGGVHGKPRGSEGERLQPLAAALFGPRISTGSELLSAVARHVLTAYEHLFTLTEGASLGIVQPRVEHQPLLCGDPERGDGNTAIEFSGREFFEDGLPDGLSSPFAWVGIIALRSPHPSKTGPHSPLRDRHIVDIGPLDANGPRFSVVQQGRSILARFVASGGEEVATPPIRLMDRRFYAVAAGLDEAKGTGQVRVFVRLHGGDARNVEVFGPSGISIGAPMPSRMTIGANLDRYEAKNGRGALMQLRVMLFAHMPSEHEIDACLAEIWRVSPSRGWVHTTLPRGRVDILFNQNRDV